jgi:hypothetical protein
MTLYGRLVGANHVEDAAVGVLRKWFPTYLHEVERQSGIPAGTIATPKSIRISAEIEKMPEDQTPTLVVASPGISAGGPVTDGARRYTAQFILELSGVVSARGGMEEGASPRALRIARLYALALRACIGQQPDDEGYLFRRDWLAENYNVLDSIDDRTICVASVRYAIEVPDVLTVDAGPSKFGPDPETDPLPTSPDWPYATDADIEVVKVPLDSEVSTP